MILYERALYFKSKKKCFPFRQNFSEGRVCLIKGRFVYQTELPCFCLKNNFLGNFFFC